MSKFWRSLPTNFKLARHQTKVNKRAVWFISLVSVTHIHRIECVSIVLFAYVSHLLKCHSSVIISEMRRYDRCQFILPSRLCGQLCFCQFVLSRYVSFSVAINHIKKYMRTATRLRHVLANYLLTLCRISSISEPKVWMCTENIQSLSVSFVMVMRNLKL